MLDFQIHHGGLASPVQSLEDYFRKAKVSIIQAAFAHSYFVDPDAVRAKTPYFPEWARRSREHYPGLEKGKQATWRGNGREVEVRLDDNQHAQMAWEKYTGHRLVRGRGYSVRHIWGHPWDPDFFTAGWNLCYMPFWAGMLTEQQHPHPELEKAIRQASWDLCFRNNPVCQPPDFVVDPGMDLSSLLPGQRVLILEREPSVPGKRTAVAAAKSPDTPGSQVERVKEIRSKSKQSWSNIRKAARGLQGLEHQPFGTPKVESSAKCCVRKILSETGLTLAQIETLLDEQGW